MVVNADKDSIVQTNHYYPYGGIIGNLSSNQEVQKYKYGGKELDRTYGLDLYDFEARQYDAITPWFTSIDPLAENFTWLTPYYYCAGDPVNCVDPDGRELRLYVETTGLGHAFITTGEGASTIVYTFGRYEGGDKHKSSWSSTDPTGAGVLVKLQGDEAAQYIMQELDKGASVFEFPQGNETTVNECMDSKLAASEEKSSMKGYPNAEAKVISKYSLRSNNCVTNSLSALETGGVDTGEAKAENSPLGLKIGMNINVAKEKILNDDRTVIKVSNEKLKKEYEKEDL